jgi:hypothetical protein
MRLKLSDGSKTNEAGFLKNLLIWSYERGTLQYDIICGLILAFIFFVPPSFFMPKNYNPAPLEQKQTAPAKATSGESVPSTPSRPAGD